MGCFIVPAAEAVITTIAAKAVKSKEREPETVKVNIEHKEMETMVKIPFSKKVKWLSKLLWGGSALLAFEHVWHGEVTPWFPFLTGAGSPADAAEMLQEMATTGVSMAGLVFVVWLGMVFASSSIEKKALKEASVKGVKK
ncbi:MAG: hypothetical protein J1F02_03560 [Lachnospiraceae bacterium]|nr:hypothetical protein [Lachnospiraceae bacterium]